MPMIGMFWLYAVAVGIFSGASIIVTVGCFIWAFSVCIGYTRCDTWPRMKKDYASI